MKLSRKILVGLTAFVIATPALANYAYRDGNQVLQTIFSFICQGSAICPAQVLIDSTGVEKATQGNPLKVDPTGTTSQPVGGFNNGVSFTPPISVALYASGQSLGGLHTIPFFRTAAQPSAILDQFWIGWAATVSPPAETVFLFDTLPSTPCVDRTTFTLAAADISKLAVQPFVLTPLNVGSAVLNSAQLNQTSSIKNHDVTATVNIYVCVTVNGSVTPASTTDFIEKISGALD